MTVDAGYLFHPMMLGLSLETELSIIISQMGAPNIAKSLDAISRRRTLSRRGELIYELGETIDAKTQMTTAEELKIKLRSNRLIPIQMRWPDRTIA